MQKSPGTPSGVVLVTLGRRKRHQIGAKLGKNLCSGAPVEAGSDFCNRLVPYSDSWLGSTPKWQVEPVTAPQILRNPGRRVADLIRLRRLLP